jgi:DNA-directed RNA polymerase subunit RPC12/RpoP
MPHELTPLIVVVGMIGVQFAVQSTLRNRFDYRCGNCGQTFSPSTLGLVLAPHRFGGMKYTRCPHCGKWSWVSPVPKQP